MGFTPEEKHYRLVFADPAMAGLVVVATAPPLGVVVDLTAMSKTDMMSFSTSSIPMESVDKLFGYFAQCLVEWNLEFRDKTPVPTTKEGLYTQKMDFVLGVIQVWMEATVSVPAPLSRGSNVGGQYPVASIPMETLSPSLAS